MKKAIYFLALTLAVAFGGGFLNPVVFLFL